MRVGVGFFVDGLVVVVEAMVDMVLLAVLVGLRENDFIGLEVGVRRFGRGPLGS